ncbi:uncharacterized protein LOC128681378 [Plodia interpunctella]|uniref:uncharacterized protein LOC128681378 n=1 Tax=Plodia interpunctella TaxID=58824 RepID=UPI0023680464|nr:uncharacterized protein LOC128681378 [Plodia interpunctella]
MLSIESYNHTDYELKDDGAEENELEEPYTRIFENHEFSESEEEMEKLESIEGMAGESKEDNVIVESKEQMDAFLQKLFRCDLYVLGRIWIEALKAVLVGAQLRLIPVVHAAKPPPPPTRPPKMRYKDLPIYDTPHYDYKEYELQKQSCPAAKTKLMHNYLLPYVKQYRTDLQGQLCKLKCTAKCTIKETKNSLVCTTNDIKKYMRDPNNIQIRQGLVGSGTMLGWMMGANVPKKIFFAGLGGLSTGALCFPEETDEAFRSFMAQTGHVLLAIYNAYCNKNVAFRASVPCTKELPGEPPKRKPQCPKKK